MNYMFFKLECGEARRVLELFAMAEHFKIPITEQDTVLINQIKNFLGEEVPEDND